MMVTIYSNETSQDKLSKAYNMQSDIVIQCMCMTNYTKTCLFLLAHFTETKKVIENLFFKAYGENSFIEKTYVIAIHWRGNSNVYKQHVIKNKVRKTILKFTINKNHAHCHCLF